MMRFIDLGKQIAVDETDPEYPREFAFYDTVTDRFLVFDGQSVFRSQEDFIEQMWDQPAEFMRRLISLMPPWVPRGKPTMSR